MPQPASTIRIARRDAAAAGSGRRDRCRSRRTVRRGSRLQPTSRQRSPARTAGGRPPGAGRPPALAASARTPRNPGVRPHAERPNEWRTTTRTASTQASGPVRPIRDDIARVRVNRRLQAGQRYFLKKNLPNIAWPARRSSETLRETPSAVRVVLRRSQRQRERRGLPAFALTPNGQTSAGRRPAPRPPRRPSRDGRLVANRLALTRRAPRNSAIAGVNASRSPARSVVRHLELVAGDPAALRCRSASDGPARREPRRARCSPMLHAWTVRDARAEAVRVCVQRSFGRSRAGERAPAARVRADVRAQNAHPHCPLASAQPQRQGTQTR